MRTFANNYRGYNMYTILLRNTRGELHLTLYQATTLSQAIQIVIELKFTHCTPLAIHLWRNNQHISTISPNL